MITVVISGVRNIRDTLRSLESNARNDFRVHVEPALREMLASQFPNIKFVKSGLFKKYGEKSDLYWQLSSGNLVLCSAWDERLRLRAKHVSGKFCLYPQGQLKYMATNNPWNVGKWKGKRYIVPILNVTEA